MKRLAIGLLVLLAASPAAAQLAPPSAAPFGSSSARPVSADGVPVVPAVAPEDDVLPRGAPADDYEFVGWCSGALSTHMELYVRVKSELDAISIRWNTVDEDARDYSDQQRSGRATMLLFDRAMRAAEAASPRNLAPTGRTAIQKGVAMWEQLSTVDARTQAYSWMNWELPERCVRVAQQLETRSNMMSAMLRSGGGAAVSGSSRPSTLPGDANAPVVNSDAPQSTAPTPSPFDALGGRLR